MHELSMAQGIIDAVLQTAENNKAMEVNEVYIEIGRLAMINPEQLKRSEEHTSELQSQ